MLAHLGAMLAHLAAYVGPCWPILGHKSRKMGTAKNTVKRGIFWWYGVGGVGRRQGRRPLSPSERRELPYGNATASSGPRGPLAGLGAHVEVIGVNGLGLAIWAHLGSLSWPILGLCWPILTAIWAHLRAMLAHLGAMLAHLGPILGLGWPILGLLADLGAYVTPCWPILSH